MLLIYIYKSILKTQMNTNLAIQQDNDRCKKCHLKMQDTLLPSDMDVKCRDPVQSHIVFLFGH